MNAFILISLTLNIENIMDSKSTNSNNKGL